VNTNNLLNYMKINYMKVCDYIQMGE